MKYQYLLHYRSTLGHEITGRTLLLHPQTEKDGNMRYCRFLSLQKARKAVDRAKDGTLVLYDHFGRKKLSKNKKFDIYRYPKVNDKHNIYHNNP